MDAWVACLLGVLQGLTEFFPVSSSGHLALFGHWFGAEPDLAFDVIVHLATLSAILVYFRNDWRQLWRCFIKKEPGDLPDHPFFYLAIATLPAVVMGVFYKDRIEWVHDQPQLVGLFLLINGIVLLAGFLVRGPFIPFSRMDWAVALCMGFAQAGAILPGISRSGATIMAAFFLGLDRRAGARFSFMMAVPVIAGAGLLTLYDLVSMSSGFGNRPWLAYGLGFFTALVSGFFALAFLMRLLQGARFFWFGLYCLIMAAAAFLVP